MPKTLSVQTGYIMQSPAVAGDNLPIKFETLANGSLKLTCEIIIPKNSQGLKINPAVKPTDPTKWEFGEVELPLSENIASAGGHTFHIIGSGTELKLNITAKIVGKKVWSLPGKVWSMG